MICATTLLLCRRHHRSVHEGRVRVSVNRDGTVLFFTPKGRMLADAPKGRVRADGLSVPASLPPVPSGHPRAPSLDGLAALPNGAALYRDSAIPWTIEAAAREAMEDSLAQ